MIEKPAQDMRRRIERFAELQHRILNDDWLDNKERRELSALSTDLVEDMRTIAAGLLDGGAVIIRPTKK